MEIARGNWVGFQTVFYHERTGNYGTNIHDVIDYGNFEIDLLGLAAYLDYGYCVFTHTPIKYVRYLLPHQSLHLAEGKICIQDNPDTTLDLLGKKTYEEDVLEMISKDVNKWASSLEGDILIPTSGGFDSRLLNVVLEDKTRVHAYTYGTSQNQSDSREVVYARELSKRLGTKWQRIELGRFNAYQDEWFAQFGCSVGSFGTYHIEFFDKIKAVENQNKLGLLSGIIGDAWAGAVHVKPIEHAGEYRSIGHTHQMTADAKKAMTADYTDLVEHVFSAQKDLLKDPKYRIITAMRTKMMLLQSLMSIPAHFGFASHSPFLDEKIALSMLNIVDERRMNRVWQRDYFRKNNILFEEEKHSYTYQNSLNYYALLHHELEPLNIEVLREVIKPSYLAWINRKLQHIHTKQRIFQTLMHTPKVKGVMKLLGFKNDLMEAYFAYTTIKPLEKLLLKRNHHVHIP